MQPAGVATGRKIRVLVVDDSAFVRTALVKRLAEDSEIDVVGYARDGAEALERVKALAPDVLTLDVEMPGLDGLATLEQLMAVRPMPVVMVSAHTGEGAEATMRALELGAVDFVLKPSHAGMPALQEITDALRSKVKIAGKAKVAPGRRGTAASASGTEDSQTSGSTRWHDRVVVMGSSTGGPKALCEVLSSLPKGVAVPFLIVQHMPAGFTRTLASRLDGISSLGVAEASDGAVLAPGRALLAPGGWHMTVKKGGRIRLHDGPVECGVRPSINVTMESVAATYGRSTLGVVMTGMGVDGTRGAGLIKAAGGEVIVEDQSTCVIYGMPKSIVDSGYADRAVPLDRLGAEIVRRCRRRAG